MATTAKKPATEDVAAKIIEEAKAEAERILAEAREQAGNVSAKPQPVKRPDDDYLEEIVDLKLFKDNGKYKDDVFVAVNGKKFQIQRGKTVQVPRYIALCVEDSLRQSGYAAELSESFQEEYMARRKELGL